MGPESTVARIFISMKNVSMCGVEMLFVGLLFYVLDGCPAHWASVKLLCAVVAEPVVAAGPQDDACAGVKAQNARVSNHTLVPDKLQSFRPAKHKHKRLVKIIRLVFLSP